MQDNSFSNLDALALLDALPVGVVIHGPDTQILHANKKALEVLRLTSDQAKGQTAMDFQWRLLDTYRQVLPLEQFPVNMVIASGEPVNGQLLGITDSTDPRVTWLAVNARAEKTADGAIERVVVTFTENMYERPDIPFKEIVDTAHDVIIVTEAQPVVEEGPKIIYVNEAFTRLTGFTSSEVIGKTPRILQRLDADPQVRARITQALQAGKPIRETLLNYSKQGDSYWLDMHIVPLKNSLGDVAYFAAIERDITEQKKLEHELHHFAHHDALTRLPNRRSLLIRLAHSILISKRTGGHHAVLFIDLNKFKQLNDTHGHEAGDLMLIEVAARLRSRVRESDMVARLGGDEFVVLLDALGTDPQDAQAHVVAVIDKITVALTEEYVLGEILHHGSASIGVKLFDGEGGTDPESILNDADAAMYAAKAQRG